MDSADPFKGDRCGDGNHLFGEFLGDICAVRYLDDIVLLYLIVRIALRFAVHREGVGDSLACFDNRTIDRQEIARGH